MRFLTLSMIGFCFLGCASTQKVDTEALPKTESSKISERLLLVVEKKSFAAMKPTPAKGKFLDYIYQIQPDHKEPGYSISTNELNNGYAYGSGPYDGWFVEFFLFRGNARDLVVKQITGYEVSSGVQKYGADITAYEFRNGKMTSVNLSTVWPVSNIDVLFEKQIKSLKQSKSDWAFHRLIRLPIRGTTSILKVCQKSPEPPFATETDCVSVGELRWNKEKFELKEVKSSASSKEAI